MVNVAGVRFKSTGKVYYFDPCDLDVQPGQGVIVETARGMEFGTVTMGITPIKEEDVTRPLKKIVRIAGEKDIARHEENEKKKSRAMKTCQEKIQKHHLEMKLIDVEYTFDNNKIIFYFTADGRVDFRELVKDLAGVFKMRIELRQIGVRDEAKMLGGVGSCGRGLCCATWLSDFQPVSIKMAKVQNLSLNPAKISGVCGRLMCCLKYENDVYSELRKGMPDVNERIETPEGLGKVIESDVLTGKIRVRIYTGEKDDTGADKLSADVYTYKKDEIERFDKKDRKPQNGGNSGAHGKGHDRSGKHHQEHAAPRNGAGGDKSLGNGKAGNRRRRRRKNRRNDGGMNPQESGGGVRGTGNDRDGNERETSAEN
ncbi:stage 0 sporulation protein [Hornefia porci]|uniref:Stage 0 sporulation protein n=1 Tax=Hornefia porci TaxID=2652292 RepID=A0A1Q9JK07_9FIRM|nr:stage 0 sporulation protein [Hornefia porci]